MSAGHPATGAAILPSSSSRTSSASSMRVGSWVATRAVTPSERTTSGPGNLLSEPITSRSLSQQSSSTATYSRALTPPSPAPEQEPVPVPEQTPAPVPEQTLAPVPEPDNTSDPIRTKTTMSKPAKPPTFNGKDTSIATVKTWAFSVKEYLELTDTPKDKETRFAGSYLDGDAKTWYINNYADVTPLPNLDDFLKEFKSNFLSTNHQTYAAEQIERIKQNKRTVTAYTAEFNLLLSETGAKKDEPWPKRHYFRGLDDEIRKGIAPSIATAKDVDGLATMAQNMANALELSGPKQTRTREESKGPIDTGRRSQSSSTGKKYPPKLSTRERTTLIANDGCFACRKINAGHVANDCPEFKDQKDNSKVKKESMVKEESVNDMSVVESESESPYSSVPVITVPAEVQGVSVTALADCGASINVLSTDTVQRQRLRTQRTTPVRVHQPLVPKGIIVNEKVISHVILPKQSWKSKKPEDFLVAPLQNHDAILGMPFLSTNNILIDPARRRLLLPGTNRDQSPDACHKSISVETVNNIEWEPTIAPELATKLHDEMVKEYSDVFANKLPNKPPNPDAPRHRIILRDPNLSINGRMFALPGKYLNKMLDFLDEHLEAGRIRPSSSHIASGTWMSPKKDVSAMPRVLHDYRALNASTVKDHTPLPRQDDILRSSVKGKFRGIIDLVTSYYQMGMDPNDVHKTAFKTSFGMFEWLVMPQGLCNAVATFQRYMNYILREYIGRFCYVYVDDIIVWSDTIEEHQEHLRLILNVLRKHGLIASQKKSILFADELEILGHIISSRGIEAAPDKLDKIIGSRVPRSTQDIKEFNGLVNYIGQFIPGLAHWSTVLSSLTKKNVPFKWETHHQEAFDNIKELARNTPICKPIDYDSMESIMLVADASNRAVGGYYGQGKDYKTMIPAGFHSRALNPAEMNYPTHDKEMLAIIDCLKKWEPQLIGTRFEILTDHKPLIHWKTQRDLSPRQIRWNETLTRFDTDIHHIPGISNSAADALSRYPYVQGNPESDDNEDIHAISIIEFDKDILESIRSSYKNDKLFGPVIKTPEHYPLFTIDDGLIYFEGRLCVPSNDRKSREVLLDAYHDSQNHHGSAKTYRRIVKDYYWPGVTQDVNNYIRSCVPCARNKSSTQAPAGLLHSMPIPYNRFSEISMDFVGPLPISEGYDMLLVMTDRLINYIKIEPVHSTATAPQIADVVYRSWYRQFGLPTAITSDRDKLFTSKFWTEMFKKIDVQLRMSTSYHPQTDGSTERANKTIIEALRNYVNNRQTDWVKHLIHVEMAFNNSVNATTGKTPTELLYGTPIRLFPVPTDKSTITEPTVKDYLQRIEDSILIARDRHAEAKTRQTTYANKHRRQEPEYKVGDMAYLDTEKLRLRVKKKGKSAKFIARFIGPFKIIKAIPETSTYKLELPPAYEIHPTIHADRLKPAFENDPELFPNREPPRPPPVIEGSEEYEIEKILDHEKLNDGSYRYLVRWLGYDENSDEWIHEGFIVADESIREYWRIVEAEGPRTRNRRRRRD